MQYGGKELDIMIEADIIINYILNWSMLINYNYSLY